MGIIGSKGDIDINSAFTVRQQNAKQLKKEVAAMKKKINANKDALAEMAEATGETFHSHSLVLAKVMQPGLRCVEQTQAYNTRGTEQSVMGASPSGLTETSRLRAEEAYTATQRLAGYTTPYSTNCTASQGKNVGFRHLTQELNTVLKAIDDLEKKWGKVSDAGTTVTKGFEAYAKASKVARSKEESYAKKEKDAGSEKMKGYRQQEDKCLNQYTTALIHYDNCYEDALMCTIEVMNDTYQRWERSVSMFLKGLSKDFDLVSEGVSGATSSRSSGSLGYYKTNKPNSIATNAGATPRRNTNHANTLSTDNNVSSTGMSPLPSEFKDVVVTPKKDANGPEAKTSDRSPKPAGEVKRRQGLSNTNSDAVNRLMSSSLHQTPKKNEPFNFEPVVKPPSGECKKAQTTVDPFSVPMDDNSFALQEDMSLPPTTKAVY